MSKKNNTSVEWLSEQIEQYILTHGNLPFNVLSKFKKQAKDLEREQMKEATLSQVTSHPRFRKIFEEQFEKYYKENYGK